MGRDASNALVLSGASCPGVSGFHCKLSVVAGELLIEDLGSRNGTWVDGEQVDKAVLRPGSTLTLGSRGPRFAVVGDETSRETVLMRPEKRRRSIGDETVSFVRDKLGIPEDKGVQEMLIRQRRRTSRLVASMAVLLVAALGVSIWALTQQDEAIAADLEARQAKLQEEIAAFRAESEADRAELLQRYQDTRGELETERDRLETELRDLREGGQTTGEALRDLQSQLARTNTVLESYDPVNLEQRRLAEVQRVQDAVVLVEVLETYHEEDSGKVLHVSYERGDPVPNTEGRGDEYVRESTGSGICLSADGFILTNAHVVREKGESRARMFGIPPVRFVSEVELNVVFHKTDQRHPARIVGLLTEGRQDLALLEIQPFDGMPFIPEVDVQAPHPEEGREVFVIGFPLGNQTLQEGKRVIASTFRGIVSRYVEPYLQVDAAVHPGASGGPMIDGTGKLLGIVVGRQKTDSYGGASLAMGFIIPIEDAAGLWPR